MDSLCPQDDLLNVLLGKRPLPVHITVNGIILELKTIIHKGSINQCSETLCNTRPSYFVADLFCGPPRFMCDDHLLVWIEERKKRFIQCFSFVFMLSIDKNGTVFYDEICILDEYGRLRGDIDEIIQRSLVSSTSTISSLDEDVS